EAPKREPGASIPWGPNHEFKDGWIDLVDPDTGATVARYRGDAALRKFAPGSNYVIVYDETEDGVPYIHLLEPRLVRTPSPVDPHTSSAQIAAPSKRREGSRPG
ncbi:MAG: hypothetical protein J4G12_03580, partial [Gemmatimonadetes bacterium]|nr:hypothetical protein [Gemmatimonadota bacterium]